ncbi:MAG: hypothetical protein K5985_02875 [Lachnospiraceae bacterium]|nr:hypothetical protein [Lachnospiraceae bacterium]
MKIRIFIALTILIVIAASSRVYAGVFDYSEESKRLMEEAGLDYENDWDEINRRQIERRNRINDQKNTVSSQETIRQGTEVRSTDYGAKFSYDEFHTAPVDIPSNDGYRSGNFDELHINENYRQDVWHPENRGGRLNGFDEFHFPDEM